ncbi:helix-turn-helix transcriptional regulator [Oribacterium sp. Sow4_G1_1]|uniref:helix-turn-helix transcriptional regulator n=1 Tax=Oribacterium sp. Sow4_G1_1 TaxID=3438794 RepID=UPI003F9ABA07
MKKEVKFYQQATVITVTIITNEEGEKEFQAPEGYVLYPMEVDDENDPAASEYDRELIVNRLVGRSSRKSYLVPVPEAMYHAMLLSEKAADKRDERAGKCQVPGKRGGLIMCRESSCRKAQAEGRCPYMNGTAMAPQQVTYIEELDEVTGEDRTSQDALGKAEYDEILDMLAKKAPKLADICRLKLAGYTNDEIGQMLHLNSNTIGTDMRRIRETVINYNNN